LRAVSSPRQKEGRVFFAPAPLVMQVKRLETEPAADKERIDFNVGVVDFAILVFR
jgi:hypothetical protein